VDKLKPPDEQWAHASQLEIHEFLCDFDRRLFATRPPWALFRGYVAYVDRYRVLGQAHTVEQASGLDAVAYLLRYHGARLTTQLTAELSHVLLDPDHLERLPEIRTAVRTLLHRPPHTVVRHVLCKAWVLESVTRKEALDERDYYP
jgi:hypothetical protein